MDPPVLPVAPHNARMPRDDSSWSALVPAWKANAGNAEASCGGGLQGSQSAGPVAVSHHQKPTAAGSPNKGQTSSD